MALSKKIDTLCSQNASLQVQINGTQESLDLVENVCVSLTPQSSASHIADAMNQYFYFDRERRKQNLVIFGLQESEGSSSSNRNMLDASAFSRSVSSQFKIKIENIRIVKTARLGRINPEKPRPLLVSLSDSSSRRYLLQNSKILRGNPEYNKVYISPDLSPKEREANKKLQMELRQRRQDGETNLIIRKGKIVPKIAASNPIVDSNSSHQAMDAHN